MKTSTPLYWPPGRTWSTSCRGNGTRGLARAGEPVSWAPLCAVWPAGQRHWLWTGTAAFSSKNASRWPAATCELSGHGGRPAGVLGALGARRARGRRAGGRWARRLDGSGPQVDRQDEDPALQMRSSVTDHGVVHVVGPGLVHEA